MAIRLMLADDHRTLREGLRRSMTDQGFDVVGEAQDGEEAVHLAASAEPDVILMDVTMPKMGGIDATRRITTEHPSTKIVMLTMHADQDVLLASMRAGASGYLVKDSSTEEIASAVRSAATGETVLSPHLAASILAERRHLERGLDAHLFTPREDEVLELIAAGRSTPDIARQLFLTQKAVKHHIASIYQKLDERDRGKPE